MAGELGFEPRYGKSESAVLPLDDSPVLLSCPWAQSPPKNTINDPTLRLGVAWNDIKPHFTLVFIDINTLPFGFFA
jgi:hypothetical protein